MTPAPDDDERSGSDAPRWTAPGEQPPPPPPPGYGYGPPPGPGWGAPRPTGGSARTGPLPLHPMTVSDVLDGAFKLMKANPRTIVVIIAVFVVPVQLLAAYATRNSPNVMQLFGSFSDPSLLTDPDVGVSAADSVLSGIAGFLQFLIVPFLAGAVSLVVAASYLGREMGPGDALRRAMRRFWPLLLSWVLAKLLAGAAFAAFAVVAVVVAVAGAEGVVLGVLAVVGGLAATAWMVAVLGLTVLVAPAIVVEELGPVAGIRRSWGLVRGRFWPVFGISLLGGFIASTIGSVLGGVPTVLSGLAGDLDWAVLFAGGVLASLVSQPIPAIVATLLYFDARIRKEGFDLQVVASELSGDRGPISY